MVKVMPVGLMAARHRSRLKPPAFEQGRGFFLRRASRPSIVPPCDGDQDHGGIAVNSIRLVSRLLGGTQQLDPRRELRFSTRFATNGKAVRTEELTPVQNHEGEIGPMTPSPDRGCVPLLPNKCYPRERRCFNCRVMNQASNATG
jgi:hypothetical protein